MPQGEQEKFSGQSEGGLASESSKQLASTALLHRRKLYLRWRELFPQKPLRPHALRSHCHSRRYAPASQAWSSTMSRSASTEDCPYRQHLRELRLSDLASLKIWVDGCRCCIATARWGDRAPPQNVCGKHRGLSSLSWS